MKTKTFLAIGLLIALIACNNENPEKSYYAALDQLTPEQIMNGRKTRTLYGEVSKVTYEDGCFAEFDNDGNLIREKARPEADVNEYKYLNPKRYLFMRQPYNILYNDTMRIDEWDNPEKLNTHYVFDEKGRLKELGVRDYYTYSEQYYYKGNALLPFKIVSIFGDESGQTTKTSLFTYTKTDRSGNWLACKVESTIKDEEFDLDEVITAGERTEHASLTRTIEYFSGEAAGNAASAKAAEFKTWPPKKFPCNIPFKVLERKNGRKFPWKIESITCTGQAKDKSGYTFVVKGTGIVDSRKFSLSDDYSATFVPEEKNSQTVNMDQAAVYFFPQVDAGEAFEFEFKGLFPGYYHEDLFVGFYIVDK
jgi:hypothetical protein